MGRTNDRRIVSRRGLRLIATELGPVGDIARTARRLEAAGYAGYWFTEHYGHGRSASPLVACAIAATATGPQFRVGTAAVLTRHRQPLQVAAAARLLASQFPGRLDVGVASAAADVQTGHSHSPLSENDASFAEAVRSTRTFLTTTDQGTGQPIAGPACEPPALWICGSSAASARLAAQVGAAFAHGPIDGDSVTTIATYRHVWAQHQSGTGVVAVLARGLCGSTRAAADTAFAPFRAAGVTPDFLGSPSECADQLHAIADQYEVETIAVAHLGDGITTIAESQERLGRAWRSDDRAPCLSRS